MKTNYTGKPRKKGAATIFEEKQLRKEAQQIAKNHKQAGRLTLVPGVLPRAWVLVSPGESEQVAFDRYRLNRAKALQFASLVDNF
ncbi:MAG: hypothetical protein RBT74_17800 [Tenuifilaceae bacterium]|nr:hypothetical protein [Tenuifilaceae bacterium]